MTTPGTTETGWMPIESAPKDGTKILVAKAGTDWITIAAHAQHKYRGHPWRELFSCGGVVWREPTHWLPLPPPPQEVKP